MGIWQESLIKKAEKIRNVMFGHILQAEFTSKGNLLCWFLSGLQPGYW